METFSSGIVSEDTLGRGGARLRKRNINIRSSGLMAATILWVIIIKKYFHASLATCHPCKLPAFRFFDGSCRHPLLSSRAANVPNHCFAAIKTPGIGGLVYITSARRHAAQRGEGQDKFRAGQHPMTPAYPVSSCSLPMIDARTPLPQQDHRRSLIKSWILR